MKRDMELIRKILLSLEEKDFNSSGHQLEIPDSHHLDISRHNLLLLEAGFIECPRKEKAEKHVAAHAPIPTPLQLQYDVTRPIRMTWNGHEFLDVCRDEIIWKTVMGKVSTKVSGVPLDVLVALLKAQLKSMLGMESD